MAEHLIPVILEFCGGCGQLLPIHEERKLVPGQELIDSKSAADLNYECENCGTTTHHDLPIKGYFAPEAAEKLRCL